MEQDAATAPAAAPAEQPAGSAPAAAAAAPAAAAAAAPVPATAGAGAVKAEGQMPIRQYLESTVVPVLMQAMQQLVRERPDDPIGYISDYLVQHNPKRQKTGPQ